MEHCTQIRLTETRLIETTGDQTNIGDSIPKLASLCLDPDKNDLNISSLIVDIESFIDIFSIQIHSKYSAVMIKVQLLLKVTFSQKIVIFQKLQENKTEKPFSLHRLRLF